MKERHIHRLASTAKTLLNTIDIYLILPLWTHPPHIITQPPFLQTTTPIALTWFSTSIPTRVLMLDWSGNICTVTLGFWILLVFCGCMINCMMCRTSRRRSMARMLVIQGHIYSRYSGDWMIHEMGNSGTRALERSIIRD